MHEVHYVMDEDNNERLFWHIFAIIARMKAMMTSQNTCNIKVPLKRTRNGPVHCIATYLKMWRDEPTLNAIYSAQKLE